MHNRAINFLSKSLIFIVLLFMMLSPAENMKLKIAIALLFALSGFLHILKNLSNLKIYYGVIVWFFIYISSGIFFTILSCIYENYNPTNYINVYVIGPIIYFCIITLINDKYFKYINKCFAIILIIVLVYNFIYALSLNHILPVELSQHLPYVQENIGGLNLGFIKITTQNVSWLLFLIPYFIAAFLLKNNKCNILINISIILGGIISALLTARTAFLLGIIITPFIVIIGSWLTNEKLNRIHILLSVFIVIMLLFFIYFSNVIDLSVIAKKVIFSFSNKTIINDYGVKDSGGPIRYEQLKDLILTWTYKPLLGWGDSASALNVIRSDSAGSYELTYVALLMQRGIIGFMLFWLQIIWIYIKGIQIIKRSTAVSPNMFCTLVGYTVFLLANATNPYVYSFDRLLILFYPLIVINYYENTKTLYCRKEYYIAKINM